MIIYVGLKIIRDSFCVESKINILIIVVILLIGFGIIYLFNKGIFVGIFIISIVKIIGFSLVVIVGIVLNRILNN